jgi:eukaryotic-like serine/threonine-protein kinase
VRACPRCLSSYIDVVEFCGIDGSQLVEVEKDPLLGRVVDRYEITDILGKGAMGCVYRARNIVLGRDFALKILFGDFAANKSLIARFQREADALSKLRHTNVVSVVDFLTTESGLNVLIMEYVPGVTLSKEIRDYAPFPPARAAMIARQIASGLAEAHRQGIVHRDVKPSNVLLVHEGADELVKLLDFGVVAVQDAPDGNKLTAAGKILGTPNYMAPEQMSETPVTPSVDLYGLGVILYEMLAGRPPFEAKGVQEVLMMHLSKPPPSLAPADGLDALAMRLLEKQPADRPPSMLDVIAEIDRLIADWSSAGIEIPRRSTSRIEPPPIDQAKKRRRLRWISGGAALGCLAITIGLAFELHGERQATITEPAREIEENPGRISIVPPEAQGPDQSVAATTEPKPGKRLARGPSPERPPDKQREKHLDGALSARHFEKTDLPLMSATAGLWKRYQGAVKSKRREEAATIANDLIAVVEIVPVSQEVLDRRLNRLNKQISASKARVPENLLEDIDNRYFDVRAQSARARTDEDRATILSRIARLEYELDKLRRGA